MTHIFLCPNCIINGCKGCNFLSYMEESSHVLKYEYMFLSKWTHEELKTFIGQILKILYMICERPKTLKSMRIYRSIILVLVQAIAAIYQYHCIWNKTAYIYKILKRLLIDIFKEYHFPEYNSMSIKNLPLYNYYTSEGLTQRVANTIIEELQR